MDQLRLFIALPLDPDIQHALHAVQGPLKQSGADIRWVREENLHLTIRFLGEVPADRALALQERLPELMADVSPFPLTVQGLGTFPPGARPRIIWAGVDDDSARKIGQIAQHLNGALTPLAGRGDPAVLGPYHLGPGALVEKSPQPGRGPAARPLAGPAGTNGRQPHPLSKHPQPARPNLHPADHHPVGIINL